MPQFTKCVDLGRGNGSESALMARPIRILQAGAWYHITLRGMERRGIFKDDRDRQHFLDLLPIMTDSANKKRFGRHFAIVNNVNCGKPTPMTRQPAQTQAPSAADSSQAQGFLATHVVTATLNSYRMKHRTLVIRAAFTVPLLVLTVYVLFPGTRAHVSGWVLLLCCVAIVAIGLFFGSSSKRRPGGLKDNS